MKATSRKTPLLMISPLCGCLLAVACTFSGCSEKAKGTDAQKKVSSPPVPVVVAQAEAKDVPVELRNVGNVEAFATVTIRSQITGQITKIHFREGQEVKAGDLLFTIDPRPSEGALKQAEADLKRDQAQLVSVRLEFERAKKLLESGIGSRDDYDKAEAAYHALEATIMSDEAAVSRARVQVEFTSIQSPIDGRTGNLMVKEGNVVKAPDDYLVTINQVHPIYITFSVPEQELPAIRQRMKGSPLMVEGEVPGETGERARGELAFIDNAVDMTTGRIKLKAVFANTNDVLWPGQFLQTRLILRTLNHATVVPDEAIQSSQTGDFVFVVKADSTAQKRPVVIGLSRGGMTVVENGVQAGETVVTDGQLRLKDGSPVTAQTKGGGQSAQVEGARPQ
jgi:multidrug efflux system membrane fusion protein